jgi:hypothetical protein
VIEPNDEQAGFAERLDDQLAEPKTLGLEGQWRKPHFSDTSHYVDEEWEHQFFSACSVWYSRVGSTRDDGAIKCDRCLKALEDRGNGETVRTPDA